MGYPITQSQTAQPLVFLMIDSSDHVTGKTGLSPTVTLSKNGAAFASPSGAVSEISAGWYKVAGNATDSATLGPLLLHATGSGADPTDDRFDVVAYNPQTASLGLSLAKTTNLTGLNDIAATAVVSNGAITTNGSGKVSGVVLADTVTTYTGNTLQTGDGYARLGAPAGASVSVDIATANAALALFSNFFIGATVSTATSTSTFTVVFTGTAPPAAGLVGLWCFFTTTGRAPEKQQITSASAVDSTHVTLTVSTPFATLPVVNDTVAVG